MAPVAADVKWFLRPEAELLALIPRLSDAEWLRLITPVGVPYFIGWATGCQAVFARAVAYMPDILKSAQLGLNNQNLFQRLVSHYFVYMSESIGDRIHLFAAHLSPEQLILQDDHGDTALHLINWTDVEMGPLVVRLSPTQLSIRNHYGQTVLHLAIFYGADVEALVDRLSA